MSKRVGELFLFDILIAILKIEHYVEDFNDYQTLKYDFKTFDALIREFQIIGEATNQLIKLNVFSKDKREIVDFRNILIHEYFGIDEEEIWDIIQNFLPIYKDEIVSKVVLIDKKLKSNIISKLLEENTHIDFITEYLSHLQNSINTP